MSLAVALLVLVVAWGLAGLMVLAIVSLDRRKGRS